MMSPSRRLAARGVEAMCGLVGRRQVIRAARFVLYRARLDVPNDPTGNGEYALQRWVLTAVPPTRPVTAFDVGANVGGWSHSLLSLARHTGHETVLHAFEPASSTYRLLVANLPETVRVNRFAVSDRMGQLTLHLVGPGAGRNSLYRHDDPPPQAEPVAATTIDEYVRRTGVRHVDLLKIDTEGHDLSVLRGAERCFQAGAISVAQFEYNHRWVHARHYLKDVFDLLGPLGYRVGKLTRRGLEYYPGWEPDLETFVEGNYVACTEEAAARLPQIRWWKG